MIFISLLAAVNPFIQEGKEFANNIKPSEISFDVNSILSEENQNKILDGKSGKELLSNGSTSNTEVTSFVHSTNKEAPDDEFLNQTDNNSTEIGSHENSEGSVIKKCYVTLKQEDQSTSRKLKITVKENPEITENVKICSWHTETEKIDSGKDNKKAKREKEDELSNNPKISEYQVDIKETGMGHRDKLKIRYRHIDDLPECNCFSHRTCTLKESEKYIDKEEWLYQGQTLQTLVKNGSQLLTSECLDNDQKKLIEGLEIIRPCWFEKLYLTKSSIIDHDCSEIWDNPYKLLNKQLVSTNSDGSENWEHAYECYEVEEKNDDELQTVNQGQDEDWNSKESDNDTFSEAAPILAVLNEIQKECQNAADRSPQNLRIFSGKVAECSKSQADDLLYNCCFADSGFANDMGFTSCTNDEITLLEAQKKGITHYVGARENSYVGVTTSKTHTFCVFPSKIARIVQDSAKTQLGLNWGSSKSPNCKGITMEEISALNFNNMDLSELKADLQKSSNQAFEEKSKELADSISNKLGESQ